MSPAFSSMSSHFRRLPLRAEEGEGLGLGNELLLDGPVLLDDVGHPLLDGGEVFGGEGLLTRKS